MQGPVLVNENSLVNVVKMFTAPGEQFVRLQKRAKSWPCAVFIIVTTVLVLFAKSFQSSGDGTARSWILDFDRRTQQPANPLASVVLAEAAVVFRIGVTAVAMFLLTVMSGAMPRQGFWRTVQVVICSYVVASAKGLADVAVVFASKHLSAGLNSIPSGIAGLDFLIYVDPKNELLASVLKAINIFGVWYLVLLVYGTAIANQVSLRKSWAIAGSAWLASIFMFAELFIVAKGFLTL